MKTRDKDRHVMRNGADRPTLAACNWESFSSMSAQALSLTAASSFSAASARACLHVFGHHLLSV